MNAQPHAGSGSENTVLPAVDITYLTGNFAVEVELECEARLHAGWKRCIAVAERLLSDGEQSNIRENEVCFIAFFDAGAASVVLPSTDALAGVGV